MKALKYSRKFEDHGFDLGRLASTDTRRVAHIQDEEDIPFEYIASDGGREVALFARLKDAAEWLEHWEISHS